MGLLLPGCAKSENIPLVITVGAHMPLSLIQDFVFLASAWHCLTQLSRLSTGCLTPDTSLLFGK